MRRKILIAAGVLVGVFLVTLLGDGWIRYESEKPSQVSARLVPLLGLGK